MVMRIVRDDETEVQLIEAKEPEEMPRRVVGENEDGPVEDLPEEGGEAIPEAEINLGVLEALLFATHHPLTAGRLGELMGLDGTKVVRQGIKVLNAQYEETGRAFRVEQ